MKYDAKAEFWRRARRAGMSPAAALAQVREKLESGEPLITWSGPRKFGMFSEYRRKAGDSVFVESLDSAFREKGYADELAQLNHTGWYADSYSDSTYRGVVLQISASRGRARFVPAYQESDSGGYVVDVSQVFEADPAAELQSARRQIGAAYWRPDMESESYWLEAAAEQAAKDCARAADSMAESAAEDAREYDEAWQAGRQFEELGEDIATTRREILAILKERRAVSGVEAPTLCGVIRARVESMLNDIRANREKRAELRDSAKGGKPDAAPDTYQARAWTLWCAFCEGADMNPESACA